MLAYCFSFQFRYYNIECRVLRLFEFISLRYLFSWEATADIRYITLDHSHHADMIDQSEPILTDVKNFSIHLSEKLKQSALGKDVQ